MLARLFALALAALSLGLGVDAHAVGHHHHLRHNELARRASGAMQLYKRFENARWTYYEVGLGACGKYNKPSDFIVALNTPQFGGGYPGPNCFKTITMTYNGKTTTATITDECPGCPTGGLDLSLGLFTFFAAESEGVIYGTWYFSDGSGGGGDPSPSPTHTPPPPVISISVGIGAQHHSPKTTQSPSSSSQSPSSAVHSTSSSSTSPTPTPTPSTPSIDYGSGVASGLAIPTGSLAANPDLSQNLNSMNHLFVNLGGFIVAAHGSA